MAKIEVKGYVNNPSTRGTDKKFSTFTLAERQTDRNRQAYKVYYSVTNFDSPTPPKESSFVTVRGWLNVRSYEKDGIKRQSLDISVTDMEVAPPFGSEGGGADAGAAGGVANDPWDI